MFSINQVKQLFTPSPTARAHAEQNKLHAAVQAEAHAYMAARGLTTETFTPSAPAAQPEKKGVLGWVRERVNLPQPAVGAAEAREWKNTAERMQTEHEDLVARLLAPGHAAGLSAARPEPARSQAYNTELRAGQQDGFLLADASRGL